MKQFKVKGYRVILGGTFSRNMVHVDYNDDVEKYVEIRQNYSVPKIGLFVHDFCVKGYFGTNSLENIRLEIQADIELFLEKNEKKKLGIGGINNE